MINFDLDIRQRELWGALIWLEMGTNANPSEHGKQNSVSVKYGKLLE
jgi:hypothetical protein